MSETRRTPDAYYEAPIDIDWTWNELEDQARAWYASLNEALEAMEARIRNGDEMASTLGRIRQQLSPEEQDTRFDDPNSWPEP